MQDAAPVAAEVPPPDRAEDITPLLRLVAREKRARNSPLWKTDTEAAFEEHGEACEAVWEELYRLLDGRPTEAPPPSNEEQIRRLLKKAMKRDLSVNLQAALNNIIRDL